MKRIVVITLVICLLMGNVQVFSASSQKTNVSDNFKVVGYYSGDLFNEPVSKLQTSKLTHIMYAFLIPNEDGSLKPLKNLEQLKALVEKAHLDGAKVYIAIGGWSYENVPLYSTFDKISRDPVTRKKFVNNIVQFVVDNNLDGVELDWEYPNTGNISFYEKLVTELSAALKSKGKPLTAALNGAWSATAGPEASKLVSDKCLNAFEFISVMGYDMNNQEHSPLWFGNTSLDYWLNRGLAPEKIVLGMPLYARPSWAQYRHLVEANPENAYKDYATGTPNDSYYNGLNTLREKTRLALQKGGGVMLFDVNEDVDFNQLNLAKYSVVSMIDDYLKTVKDLTFEEIKNYVTVVINNEVVKMSPKDDEGAAFVDENYRTMIPMRKLLEAFGAEITWIDEEKKVTAVHNGTIVTVKIGDEFINVNAKNVEIDTKAVLKEGRTYIPVRAVLEAFGFKIKWSDVSKTMYCNN